MTRLQKTTNTLTALVMAIAAIILIVEPAYGHVVIVLILSITLMFRGIRSIWYYAVLSRHMVGGLRTLFRGIIVFDAGLLTLALSEVPRIYVILYLSGVYIISGTIDILSALDARRQGSVHYKLKLTLGIINMLVGISCIALVKWVSYVVYIYAAGLIYNAIMRMINVFRKHEMVYIQ